MAKYKVCKRYFVTGKTDTGTMIEITKIKNGGTIIEYKDISGRTIPPYFFMPGSSFAKRLREAVPVHSIKIERKGSTVVATNEFNGTQAIAKCSPEDKFDFYIGAKLAFDRLIGLSKDNESNEKKENFKPYIAFWGENYGYIGEKTNLVDILGKKLDIRDIVEVFSKHRKPFMSVIAKSKLSGKPFVMELQMCDFTTPYGSDGFHIILKKKYSEVKDNEIIHDMRYILKERK